MIEARERACQWLYFLTKKPFSELGKDVDWFLDTMWGLHNLNRTSLSKIDWENDTWICFTYNHYLSTFDGNDLTRLVVIAHQRMLRVSLKGVGPGYIQLMFHKRTTRTGNIYEKCPDILEHVNEIIKYHPDVMNHS